MVYLLLAFADDLTAQEMATPSQHRTRLGPSKLAGNSAGDYRNHSGSLPPSSQSQTPTQRQPFGTLNINSINRPSVSGYGMSAGMKVGRQQSSGKPFSIRCIRTSPIMHELRTPVWLVQRPSTLGPLRPQNRFTHPLAQSQQLHHDGGASYF